MNKKDLRKFLELVSRNAGSGDFEIYLDMNRRQVEEKNIELGIDSAADAKKLLKELDSKSESELSEIIQNNTLNERRVIAERQARYDDLQAKNKKLDDQKAKKAKKMSAKKAAAVKKQRENRLEKINNAAIIVDSKWVIPQDSSKEEFLKFLKNRGMGFVRDKYGISNRDILATIQKLKLNIDIDLLPR